MLPLLIAAVKSRKPVSFVYRGTRRTMEPHAVGIGHDGQAWISGFQTAGNTVVPGQHWLYCNVDAVESLEIFPARFNRPRPGYSREDSRFQRFFAAL